MPFTSRPIRSDLVELLRKLQPGQRIRITHSMRVGSKTWPAVATGVYRGFNSLATGITTQRLPQDDIIVPVVHFLKDNKELSSVALDEHSMIEVLP